MPASGYHQKGDGSGLPDAPELFSSSYLLLVVVPCCAITLGHLPCSLPVCCLAQMLSKALLETHSEAEAAGLRFSPEVFVAGRNRLENEGATALAEVLSAVSSLKCIQMPQNSIFHQGVASLAQAVLANPQLEVRSAPCRKGVGHLLQLSGLLRPLASLKVCLPTRSTWTSVITSLLRPAPQLWPTL